MISNKSISQIMDAAKVEEVIGEYLTLKKRGANYIALCPFHSEKTPSFTVSPEKGIYKCFGCGKGGNTVNFLIEHEHYSYPEALRHLAQKYGIELEETQDSAKDKQEREVSESLFIINQYAAKYFSGILKNDEEGKRIGLSYFKERGFRENTIETFGLGYSLDKKQAFTDAALKDQYKLEYLKELGLTQERGSEHFDFFRGRVLFPIHNISGKVIAFAGRTLKQDGKGPKYINSQESAIYHKSKVLYGLNFARKAISENDECLVVEGYTDVISLHQAGITHVVASSGTSLTHDQIRLIGRYTHNITILFDADDAGIKASFRGIDLILEQDMNVKIVSLEKGEDPDSAVSRLGSAAFIEFIQSVKSDFVLFKTNLLLEEVKDDPVKKAGLIKEIVETIAIIPDAIKSALYIKECSRLLNIEEQILLSEYNKFRRKAYSKSESKDRFEEENAIKDIEDIHLPSLHQPSKLDNELQESDIIRVLLEHGTKMLNNERSVVDYILSEVEDIVVDNELYSRIIAEFKQNFEKDKLLNAEHFINHQENEISKIAVNLLATRHELSENWYNKYDVIILDKEENFKADVFKTIAYLKLFKVYKLIQEHDKKMLDVDSPEEEIHLQQTHLQYLNTKKQIANYLGTVVVK